MRVISDSVEEKILDYSVKCAGASNCELNFELIKPITKPVFVYYELKNFYQNSKVYVKSVSMPQLGGKTDNEGICDACLPITVYFLIKMVRSLMFFV